VETPRILEEHTVFSEPDSAHFTVTRADTQMQDGTVIGLHFASVKEGRPGAVCIGIHDGKLLLAQHWRASTNTIEWEFPRGMGEPGESLEQTALREFTEETGLRATSVTILQSIHADTGVLRDSIGVAVLDIPDIEVSSQTDWELSNLSWISPDQLDAIIRRGEIHDGITLAAYLVWGKVLRTNTLNR
jgi:ADP-ribose pyrophosphatase